MIEYGWNSTVFTTVEDFWEKRGFAIPQRDEKESYEISLDLIDEMDIDSEQEQMPAARMGYDVGRSGRKYTASELEKLIKE